MGKELQQPANMTTNQEEWIPRRFTNVWIRSENGWQLIPYHQTAGLILKSITITRK